MATVTNILGFHQGEDIDIDLFAKEPDGSVIATPASQAVNMTVSVGEGTPALAEVSSGSGITLADEATGKFSITMTPSDLSALTPGVRYRYGIWTTISGASTLQAKGELLLHPATTPTLS